MQAGTDKTFHLKWNNHLQNLSQLFSAIYTSAALADVTLACRDGSLRAHKLVLSACSPYFEQIFKDNPCKHPVVILKGIPFAEINLLVEFMYKGSVDVQELDLQSLMHTASDLEIRGLAYEVRANAAQLLNVNLEYPASPAPTPHPPHAQHPSPHAQRTDLERLKQIHMYQQSVAAEAKRRPPPPPVNTASAAVKSILAAAAKELAESGRSAASVQTDTAAGGEAAAHIKTEALHIEEESWTKPKKRVSIFTPEEEKQRKRKLQYSVTRSPQREPGREDSVGRLLISAVGGGGGGGGGAGGGVGGAGASSGESPKLPGCIKVVQLSALQRPSQEEPSDDEEASELLQERGRRTGEEEDDDSCSSEGSEVRSRGTRPHVCDICDLRFQRASHLSRHRLTHTGERPFTCGGCGKSFARSDKLRLHTKICEKEDPTVEMCEEGGGGARTGEVMSGMVRMTHRESGQLMFTPSGDVILPPRLASTTTVHRTNTDPNITMREVRSEGGAGDTPAKRGRGRPRKYVVEVPKIKKKRGRPPKVLGEMEMMMGLHGNGSASGSSLGSVSELTAAAGMGAGGTVPLQQHTTPSGHQYIVKRKRGRPPKNYFQPLSGSALPDSYFDQSRLGAYKTYGRPKENYNATNLPFGDFSYLTEMMYNPAYVSAMYPHVTTVDPGQEVDLDSTADTHNHTGESTVTEGRSTIDLSGSSTSEDDTRDEDPLPVIVCQPEMLSPRDVPQAAPLTVPLTVGDCQIVKVPPEASPPAALAPAPAPLTTTIGDCTIQPVQNNT